MCLNPLNQVSNEFDIPGLIHLHGKHSSWRLIWAFISWTGDVVTPEYVVAAGGAPGEAHVVSRLQLRLREVAAVQPQSSSSSSPEAADRSVQRLPHAGLRLCAPLHSGIQLVLLLCCHLLGQVDRWSEKLQRRVELIMNCLQLMIKDKINHICDFPSRRLFLEICVVRSFKPWCQQQSCRRPEER